MGRGASRRERKARILLTPALPEAGGIWAEMGCGDGVFTRLLCARLPPGSTVYAVDRDRAALSALARSLPAPRIPLHIVGADFTRPLDLPPLDGIFMANSLHFVDRKAPVLGRLVALLRPGGRLVVVEYNARRGNYAVPHPLDDAGFLALARDVGLGDAHIAARAPSSFLGEMYTGVATRRPAG